MPFGEINPSIQLKEGNNSQYNIRMPNIPIQAFATEGELRRHTKSHEPKEREVKSHDNLISIMFLLSRVNITNKVLIPSPLFTTLISSSFPPIFSYFYIFSYFSLFCLFLHFLPTLSCQFFFKILYPPFWRGRMLSARIFTCGFCSYIHCFRCSHPLTFLHEIPLNQ